jgi:hypothetical protein
VGALYIYLSGNLQEVEVFYRTICKARGSEIENYYLSNDCDKQFFTQFGQ